MNGSTAICPAAESPTNEAAQDYYERHPDWYKSVEDAERELCWSIGDWLLTDENSEDFQDVWDKYQTVISDEWLDQDESLEDTENCVSAKFLAMACRVAHKLNSEKAYDCSNRSEDFKYFVCDHDETDEDSWERMEGNKWA